MEGRLVNDKYIAQAATQEEAIIKGLNALGITKDEAKITVEEPGKKGFLGIGQKDAVVIVERKEKVNIVDELLNNELNIERDSSRKDVEKRNQTDTAEDVKKEEKLEDAAYATEEFDDHKKAEAEAQESEMDKEEFTEGRDPAEVEIIEEDDAVTVSKEEKTEESEEESEEEKQERIEKDDQEAVEDVRQYLEDIILAMDIPDVEVYTSRVDNNVKYDIETENAGLVIGRHGKVLNGLQTLAQNHMHQLAHSKLNVRVDAEKYRERRRNTVETLAERTADKALKTKRKVKLDPMPAHERKAIHRYLNNNPRVKTYSEGREPKRYLVVEPAEN